jgi:hypothetical protein
MSEIDNIIGGMQSISDAAYLRDLVFYAREAAKPRCGSCYFWMMSKSCPREKNVGGMSRGPSSGETPCDKYRVLESTLNLAALRRGEANSFAVKHRLTLPFPSPSTPGAEGER